ncbi:hypothetical protein SOVF_006140 [Spinacia oleracea]|nr:hypothetical protein SOVF_006140 [Spinacia oleracea]
MLLIPWISLSSFARYCSNQGALLLLGVDPVAMGIDPAFSNSAAVKSAELKP